MEERGLEYNIGLLKDVTKGLGPSIYKRDAETISGSGAKELLTVKNNFLIKKLGLEDGPKLDVAIAKVIDIIGKSERSKYRAVVYYMLAVEFGKVSIYN